MVYLSFDDYVNLQMIAEGTDSSSDSYSYSFMCDVVHVREDKTIDILKIVNKLAELEDSRNTRKGLHSAAQQQQHMPHSIPIVWERDCLNSRARGMTYLYGERCPPDTVNSHINTLTRQQPEHNQGSSYVDWHAHGVWFRGMHRIDDNNDRPLHCGMVKHHSIVDNRLIDVWYGTATSGQYEGNRFHSKNKEALHFQKGKPRRAVHFVITFSEAIFLETALEFRDALLLLDYSTTQIDVMGYMNLTRITEIIVKWV